MNNDYDLFTLDEQQFERVLNAANILGPRAKVAAIARHAQVTPDAAFNLVHFAAAVGLVPSPMFKPTHICHHDEEFCASSDRAETLRVCAGCGKEVGDCFFMAGVLSDGAWVCACGEELVRILHPDGTPISNSIVHGSSEQRYDAFRTHIALGE